MIGGALKQIYYKVISRECLLFECVYVAKKESFKVSLLGCNV